MLEVLLAKSEAAIANWLLFCVAHQSLRSRVQQKLLFMLQSLVLYRKCSVGRLPGIHLICSHWDAIAASADSLKGLHKKGHPDFVPGSICDKILVVHFEGL